MQSTKVSMKTRKERVKKSDMHWKSLRETKNAVTLPFSILKRFPKGLNGFAMILAFLFVPACVDKWEKWVNEQENMFSLELWRSALLILREYASCG